MKKIIALLLCIVSLCLCLFMASCDYQADVDSVRSEMMEGAKDLLDPFLNQIEEEEEGEETNDSDAQE